MTRKKNSKQNSMTTRKGQGSGTSAAKSANQKTATGSNSKGSSRSGGLLNGSISGDAKIVTFNASSSNDKMVNIANGSPPNGGGKMHKSPSANALSCMERQTFVLWKRPLRTILYFILEVFCLAWDFIRSMLCFRRLVPAVLSISLFIFLYTVPGLHTDYVQKVEKKLFWCLYWVGLGVLSSVGLGTGLHTFLLYLGPHIARVTLAAFECNSLDFPEPPYPNDVTCPATTTEDMASVSVVSLWTIISKVRLESLMWGAGTALGELPPYFMARAARLSGQTPDDEDYKEFIAIVECDLPKEMSLMEKCKLWMEQVVTRIGFPGILLFASVPNPFFDLAGITCGHFLIPFWTFFGATLVGKALVKMHVQMLFVVLTFSEHHVEHLVSLLKTIPRIGPIVQAPLKEFLGAQKLKLHRKPGDPIPEQASSILQLVMSYVVSAMILWFVISLVNSLAQRYHKRKWESEKRKQL